MLSKRQKKLLSHAMRDYVRSNGKRELWSLQESYHTVVSSDGESWVDFTIIRYNHDVDKQLDFLYDFFDDMVAESRASLPEWDCSGRAYLAFYELHCMPYGIAISLHYFLDV